MKTIKKIWSWLNGKKTVIGTTGYMLCTSLPLPEPYKLIGQTIFGLMGGVGIIHKKLKGELKK